MSIVVVALVLASSLAFGSIPLRQQISAISSRSVPLYKVLADLNAVDTDGRSALHHAVMLGDFDLVKLFLINGAETRIRDHDGNLPLYYAEDLAYADVEAGQVDSPHFAIISWLLQHMGNNVRDRKSWNALHWTVLSGDLKRAELLLDEGFDPTYGRHQNPLDVAFLLRNKEMFTLLLKGRIGKKKVDLNNNNLFVVMRSLRASPYSSLEPTPLEDLQTVISWIAEVNTSVPLPNLVTIYGEDTEIAQLVQVALDLGFDVNSVGNRYRPPLLLDAAHHGKVATIKTLLANGADPNVYYSDLNKNALHMAAQEGHAEAINVLLDDTDIDIDAIDKQKYSALMRAARNGRYQAVRVLKERGADQTLLNYQGHTALDLARTGLRGSIKRRMADYQQTIELLEEGG